MPPPASSIAVRAEALVKTFGTTRALDGVDLEIPSGTVLGLLGPNGAGKTTTVRILTTLLKPDSGRAFVAGHDVVADPDAVRRSIGLSGQYAAVDEHLTGYENLYMVGRLYGMSRSDASTRARELISRFRLDDAGDRPSKTYSGGMRRRLDLAGALVAQPAVVVLDEPTTGLDPRGRMDTWEIIGELVADGTTVLLTTQYLEEADQLADTILVIDHGKVIAGGTADQLKAQVGGERLEIVVADAAELAATAQVLAEVGSDAPTTEEHQRKVLVKVDTGPKALVEALRRLDQQNVSVLDVGLHRPTLDDVFLALTGHLAEEKPEAETDDKKTKGRKAKSR
ncbi:ATP-binding cassette domain-containing protein [Actinokineospora globicatena]|uniref:ATP-binding cassette domain-containing protein n=1 Tax=Actinokineospora globicatena TaxID=103729 RepID=UPI0020A58916|nr:ATP-binding cassette domain-containing protein [Actinokineospora globicatena]MCP2301149.1 ABC-2 type transport system ATP-binding protein [Actinokineospora globicatena]GLW77215.1 daunorubicin resistance protein DrrA family ABC transporter ATP-binding protein [Actinokineospora globicatena]GLW84049.1 daunorubicin resistance protein DrrA family ABC transporter ATP-binding protein [Actinokineospora globicatena]